MYLLGWSAYSPRSLCGQLEKALLWHLVFLVVLSLHKVFLGSSAPLAPSVRGSGFRLAVGLVSHRAGVELRLLVVCIEKPR